MKTFEWNKARFSTQYIWDPASESEMGIARETSLKDRLANPNHRRTEDAIADICIGLAMIMDKIEELENEKDR